jgi:peroxiredoxin
MTRVAPSLAALLAVLAALAGVVLVRSTTSRDTPEQIPAPPRSVAPAPAAEPAAPPAPSGSTATGPRPGSLEAAIRELDLIKPSREKVAEDFTLPTPDGKSFRLSEHRGKAVLVNFWATWCPPCREEMPAMERLYQGYKDRGLVLVAISLDTDPKVVTPFVREQKLTFPIALDPKAEVANTYGVRALPSSFVIDRRGSMAALALGPREWDNAAAKSLVEALTR